MKLLKASALVAVALALASKMPVVGQNLLQNGSFESGPKNVDGNIAVEMGSKAIPNWDVTTGSVDYVRNDFAASDGTFSIDLDGWTFGGIAQTFVTIPDAFYRVNFDMAANTAGAPTVKKLRVLAAGQSKNFTFNMEGRGPRNMGWIRQEWIFTARSATTTIEFESRDFEDAGTEVGRCGPALDNVSVVRIENKFIRGDVGGDGAINITDAIALLQFLFLGGGSPHCFKSADLDDNGRVTISDAIGIFLFLFLGSDQPKPPFPLCGGDPVPDALTCKTYPICN